MPYWGTDLFFGGEDYTSRSVRADYVLQATDHHRVQAGASYLWHDIVYDEIVGLRGNSGIAQTVTQLYRAKPTEISSYLQDVVEYDFLSIRFGLRYDYGLAKGKGLANPLNSTNGTSAREVCNGTAAGINETPFTYQGQSGVLACLSSPANEAGKPFLLDSATRLAQVDDFKEAEARTSFSPRIGLSFPLTERSGLFFNAGRYTRNPSYHDVYRNSGVGTNSGLGAGTDNFCSASAVKPGTDECHPPVGIFNLPEFIGNPNLLAEQTTSYEVGYSGQIGQNYAIDVNVYNQDQSGLTGTRQNDATQDIGSTYNNNALPQYSIAVNQDFLTSRGMEIQFRRRLVNRWSYNVNYGWQRTTENAPPPDRQFEAEDANELNQGGTLRENISGRDQGHRINGSLVLAFRTNDVPQFPGNAVLKNSRFSLTYSWNQGRPYTPNRNFAQSGIVNTLAAGDQNTGRGPSTQSANLQYAKEMTMGNARYGFTVRVTNIFNIQNCNQVFANTGTCDTGVRDFNQRRVGNQGATTEGSSTNRDQPETRSDGRRFFTGITVNF
jgi:outer membrane receptor protein involved in Fe transport